jgi:hypothetical protein
MLGRRIMGGKVYEDTDLFPLYSSPDAKGVQRRIATGVICREVEPTEEELIAMAAARLFNEGRKDG